MNNSNNDSLIFWAAVAALAGPKKAAKIYFQTQLAIIVVVVLVICVFCSASQKPTGQQTQVMHIAHPVGGHLDPAVIENHPVGYMCKQDDETWAYCYY